MLTQPHCSAFVKAREGLFELVFIGVKINVCPEWFWIDTHGNADTLSKQQITDLEIGLLDEMGNKKFNLLFGEAVITFFIFSPKDGKFSDRYFLFPFLVLPPSNTKSIQSYRHTHTHTQEFTSSHISTSYPHDSIIIELPQQS